MDSISLRVDYQMSQYYLSSLLLVFFLLNVKYKKSNVCLTAQIDPMLSPALKGRLANHSVALTSSVQGPTTTGNAPKTLTQSFQIFISVKVFHYEL